MSKELKAFAIGPDRFDVVVGFDRETVVAWYKDMTGLKDYEIGEVREIPMDKEVTVENPNGKGLITTTVRDLIKDVKHFPALAFFCG